MRDSNVELLAVMLEALSKEHDILYQSLLTPITSFIMEILPENHRETTKTELAFEDLDNVMPVMSWSNEALSQVVDAMRSPMQL